MSKDTVMPGMWQSIATRKQEERASRIPKQWLLPSPIDEKRLNVLDVPRESGLLTEAEIQLTENFDASALLSGLANGFLRSVDVVTAFCKSAAIAQEVTNCLAEIFFDDAVARARQLDEILAKTGKPMGPLHGLPISLKDTFKIKGYDSSVGVAAFCFKPASTNSALVDLLLELGGVLYCKTNVPQTMMALDSHNNVFGRTLNPANRALTAGGSSGGEGALIAMRGSILGVGTDIGGSIRVPALCNGLYGVKPSHGRVPYAGQEGGALPGSSKVGIEATAGPIATSQRDCELLLRVICDGQPERLDPDVFSQSWERQDPLLSSGTGQHILRVGMMRTDGHVTPLPPIQRLLDEVAQTLSPYSQIEVIDLDISILGPQCVKTFNGVMSIDGANTWLDHLERTGEPLSPWLSNRLKRRPQKSLDEVRQIQASRTELQTKFLDVWQESGGYWRTSDSKHRKGDRTLDVIICPGAPHPVAAIDLWNSTNYTSMFNLLDLPAGILPVRTFEESDLRGEIAKEQQRPLNGWDKINKEMWTGVDREVYLGSALTVQVVAPRLMERRLVQSMKILDEALLPLRMGGGGKSKL